MNDEPIEWSKIIANQGTSIPEIYVRLALDIDRHIPGYIDSYYGPAEWREAAQAREPRPLDELLQAVNELAAALASDQSLEPQRRDYLRLEAGAMQMCLRLLRGERVSLEAEARAIYDLNPEWTDEALFEETHRALDDLLPPGDSLRERFYAWRTAGAIQLDPQTPLVQQVITRLRQRTDQLFQLPEGEAFNLEFVNDQPWGAYNHYLGNLQSRIEVNTDVPTTIPRLVFLVAHEGYAGHHTELACKEQHLTRQRGWLEQCLSLLYSPACVIAEGIAMRALEVLLTDEELIAWLEQDLFPLAGLDPAEARRGLAISKVGQTLQHVPCNALIMMAEHNTPDEQLVAYIQRHGLGSEREVQSLVAFLKEYRAYAFTYTYGYDLLGDLFAAQGDPVAWFERLLKELVTPGQVRSWIKAGTG